jgi:hypothetical protein
VLAAGAPPGALKIALGLVLLAAAAVSVRR